jgi:TRAP-type C4-dicarboxylate transport system permease small subunit
MNFMKDWWRFIDYYGQQLMSLVFIIAAAVIIFYGLEQIWKWLKRKAKASVAKPAADKETPVVAREGETSTEGRARQV